jgi:predicted DNA-binding protein
MPLRTITVKVDEELRRKMSSIRINWSEYIREVIRQRIELEERRNAAKKLLEELKAGETCGSKGIHKQDDKGDEGEPLTVYVVDARA